MSDLTAAAISPDANVGIQLAQQAQQNIRPLDGRDVQGAATEKDKKFDKIMQDYEGVFLSQMIGHMSEGVGTDPLFGGGQAETTMKSLLYNEYGKMMAARGGIGLAAAMKKQLLHAQEQVAAAQQPSADPAAAGAAAPGDAE